MPLSKSHLSAVFAIVLLSFGLGTAAGSVILDSPLLPPESDPLDCDDLNSVYADVGAFLVYDGPMPVMVFDPILKCFQNVVREPFLGSEIQYFDAVFEGRISFMGMEEDFVLTGPMVSIAGEMIGPVKTEFNVQILEMALNGFVMGNPVIIRQSMEMPSYGMTTVVPYEGGGFEFDSFFDVFTEVSIDGGTTWISHETPAHMELLKITDPLPLSTPMTWSAIKSQYR